MRWSQAFIPTLRDDPADAEVASHKLLLRAGLIRQLAAGLYSSLPLAQRSILKICAIIREEMNRIGAQEFHLPALHPMELWQETGRWAMMGDNLFRLKDRKGGQYCLGMTHEEIFTDIARRELRSYKQLPQVWYQIQAKFRDEPRPKSGLLRVRQFTMKDAYSLDADWDGLDKSYEAQRGAYARIFTRCGLRYTLVEADTGVMGGATSSEFMVYSGAGEDLVASCPKCGYAANLEKAASRPVKIADTDAGRAVEKFPTPGVHTIEDLAKFEGGASADRQIKSLVYIATVERNKEQRNVPLLALLRGDHSLNEHKLAAAVAPLLADEKSELLELRPAQPQEIVEALGAGAGSLGAVGVTKYRVFCDEALRGRFNLTTGANEDGYHLRGVNVERDLKVTHWADLRLAGAGELCPHCDGALAVSKALEVGHIFKLGALYSERMGARVLTADGKDVPIVMGCYGIGVERVLVAAVELHHDSAGIIFPASIAPFQVIVSPLNVADEPIRRAGEQIYAQLNAAGVEVLYDDRDERAGVKLNDADLIGIPFRVTIGQKKLKTGQVELYDRATRKAEDVAVNDAARAATARVEQALRQLNNGS